MKIFGSIKAARKVPELTVFVSDVVPSEKLLAWRDEDLIRSPILLAVPAGRDRLHKRDELATMTERKESYEENLARAVELCKNERAVEV